EPDARHAAALARRHERGGTAPRPRPVEGQRVHGAGELLGPLRADRAATAAVRPGDPHQRNHRADRRRHRRGRAPRRPADGAGRAADAGDGRPRRHRAQPRQTSGPPVMIPSAKRTDPSLELLVTEPWPDFELLDRGHGRKLERYGTYRFRRPEPQALWQPALPEWQADAEFVPGNTDDTGKWQSCNKVPDAWPLTRGDIRFWGACTPLRHLAFFPDMAPQWDFMRRKIEGAQSQPEVLNLFGYTGLASL